jgi:NTP pyrophosphatase (non-canonical NTP hydrolase)
MSQEEPEYFHDVWYSKADENVHEWGMQLPAELLLAMQEEMGELTQAWLEAAYEGEDVDRVAEECNDLAALCVQLRWSLREHPDAFNEIRAEL